MNELIITILIFAGLQLINVILNTLKTLIMAKFDSPHASALINAVTFGFYTVIVNQIAHLDLTLTITVTVITNVIGVYATYGILKKFKKDELWKVEIFNSNPLAIQAIKEILSYKEIPISDTFGNCFTAYCYTPKDSELVNKTIKEYDGTKYNITVISKKFR